MDRNFPGVLNILWPAMLGLMLCITSGCPAVAWTAATFMPPEAIPPEFEFPEKKTVLVLVEDPGYIIGDSPIKYQLTTRLNEQLKLNEIAWRIISQKQLMNLKAATKHFQRLSIQEVGKKAGADIVLYVKIDEFAMKDDPNSPIWHGKLKTSVRVISVEEGRLWPKDLPEGHPVRQVETERTEGDASEQFEEEVSGKLANQMADIIARLFYKQPGRPHGSLPPKDTPGEL